MAMLGGEVRVGSPCMSPMECRQPRGAAVPCTPEAPNTTKGHCTLVPPPPAPPVIGKSGDACSTTCRTSATDGCAAVEGLPTGGACLLADGLVCDAATHVCVAVPQVGEPCAPACAIDGYCDAQGKCQTKTADGSCAGALDACTDASLCACGEATCDPSKFVCVPRGVVG